MIVSALVVSGAGLAQMKNRASEPQLVTRIAYRGTYGVDWREQQGSPQICFALYPDRYYRLSKLTESGIEAFQGTISKRQFFEIAEMLKHLEVQKRENGITLQGSESLIVDLTGKSDRYTWVDADHQDPFPKSVANIVDCCRDLRRGVLRRSRCAS
jgi:hypothetical protein